MIKAIMQAVVGSMCQSCGMPLNKDPKGGGSEKDGTISKTYCSYCYNAGAFVQPTMTLDQMVELVNHKMAELKMPSVMAKLMVMVIPSLQRWKMAKS